MVIDSRILTDDCHLLSVETEPKPLVGKAHLIPLPADKIHSAGTRAGRAEWSKRELSTSKSTSFYIYLFYYSFNITTIYLIERQNDYEIKGLSDKLP